MNTWRVNRPVWHAVLVMPVVCIGMRIAHAQSSPLLSYVQCPVLVAAAPIGMTAAGFDNAGNAVVAMLDGAPAANQVLIVPTNPQLFAQRRCDEATAGRSTVSVNSRPSAIAAGDLDTDRITDLAVAELGGVLILRGAGNGRFVPDAAPISAGSDPQAVVIADVDRDGNPDIVAGDFSSVTIVYGRSFSRTTVIPVNSPVASVAVGLLSADSLPDIATASKVAGDVTLLFQNPDHSFAAPVSFKPDQRPGALVIDDLNADAQPDLAVTGAGSPSGRLNIYFGPLAPDAIPPLNPSGSLPTGDNPTSLAVGDLNGDGLADVVVANQGDNTVSFFLGRRSMLPVDDPANCEIQDAEGHCAVGAVPRAVVAAEVDGAPLDVDGDGRGDVVTANQSGSLTVLLSSQPTVLPSPTGTETPTVTATATPSVTLTPTAGGDCCTAHNGPSCGSGSTDVCASCVCDLLPSCCSDTWTQRCVDLAQGQEGSGCDMLCRCGEPTAMPSKTPTSLPTGTPTDTRTTTPTGPTATATRTPTETLVPTRTATVTPTATALPTRTLVPTAGPTATPECFAAGVCVSGPSCAIVDTTQVTGRHGGWVFVPVVLWMIRRGRRSQRSR
jgi:hypothetical protein